MARELDAKALQAIAQFAGVEFTLVQLGTNYLDPAAQLTWEVPAMTYLPEAPLYMDYLPTSMKMRYLLRDLEDKPFTWINIQMDRKLMEQAHDVMREVLVQLTMVALATGVVLLVTVHFWLVRPIGRLRKDVADVSAKREWDQIGRAHV